MFIPPRRSVAESGKTGVPGGLVLVYQERFAQGGKYPLSVSAPAALCFPDAKKRRRSGAF